jgi:hypothetical protein
MRGVIVAVALLGAAVGVGCRSESETAAGSAGAGAAKAADAKSESKSGDVGKAGDEKRDEGGGLAKTVREISEGKPARDPVLPPGEGIAVPAAIPPGNIVIEHVCGHSMQPFGTGYWSSTSTVDLAAGTFKSLRVEGDTGAVAPLPGTETEKRTESSATLSPADVTRIRGALDEMLAGGPYEPDYALSEGIVCTLELRVGSEQPFFRIDKSRGETEDAVTRLIASLGSTTPP